MEEKKEYNPTITPLWVTGNGNYKRTIKSQEDLDSIRASLDLLEVGGQLLIKIVDDSRRSKENSPHAYVEYQSKSKMDEARALFANRESVEGL